MWRAKFLGHFRARLFLAACATWKTTQLCSHVKARHQLCCYVRSLVFHYSSRERRGLGTGFPNYSEDSAQSPAAVSSDHEI